MLSFLSYVLLVYWLEVCMYSLVGNRVTYRKSWEVDVCCVVCFFQSEDGIRVLVRSRGLGDVYKRQGYRSATTTSTTTAASATAERRRIRSHVAADGQAGRRRRGEPYVDVGASAVYRADERAVCGCLLYTSDAADDLLCVDVGGRRIIKKNKKNIFITRTN